MQEYILKKILICMNMLCGEPPITEKLVARCKINSAGQSTYVTIVDVTKEDQ